MPSAIKTGTQLQIGEEVTAGTLVPATRIIVADEVRYRRQMGMRDFSSQMTGSLARSVRPNLVTRQGSEVEVTAPLDFEQILWGLHAGMQGGITPTMPGTGEARLYTFTPPVAADPAVETYTVEFVEDDMTNEAEMEFGFGFCTEIEITADIDGTAELRMVFMGRKTADGTKTPALTLPVLTYTPDLRWTVDIDTVWANLGMTQVTGQVLGFTWRWSDFLFPRFTLEGRLDNDFNAQAFKGARVADLTMNVLVDPAAGGLVNLEEANKEANPPVGRAIRLELLGAAFDAPDTALFRMVRIDGFYDHAEDSIEEHGTDDEGNLTASLHFRSTLEVVENQDIEVSVQNNLAAWPV